ncbi:hypothetical protein CCR75_008910 [Bremia lactucae]|uniref:Uncharacterized protein n=1 Tax=Bremia lactucae TaxID=4779 RepID=A0A976FQX6_BRELC|nr:hypothetical protein CCR75_008910 [Bremia lactucae]
MQTEGTLETPVRARIAAQRSTRQRTTRQWLLRKHSNAPRESSKRFFARVSTNFSDNTVVSLDSVALHGLNRSRDLAEATANDWKAIVQGDRDARSASGSLLSSLICPRTVDDASLARLI